MIIYKITNKINGKVYVGQTTKSLIWRWSKHCSNGKSKCFALYNAIQKYGKENFTVEQIDVACDRDELDKKEVYWIAHYDSMNPNKGYNLTSGGKHPFISDDVKKRLSEKNKGKIPSYKCIFNSIKARKGKTLTEEHRKKLGESRKGNKNGMFGVRRFGTNNPNAKKVLCVERDCVFNCLIDACCFINRDYSALYRCLSGKSKTCGGYHWRFADEK